MCLYLTIAHVSLGGGELLRVFESSLVKSTQGSYSTYVYGSSKGSASSLIKMNTKFKRYMCGSHGLTIEIFYDIAIFCVAFFGKTTTHGHRIKFLTTIQYVRYALYLRFKPGYAYYFCETR